MASPSVTSSDGVQIMRCPVLFNGTNYRDWVPRLRWHMRGLRLWEFITGDIPCPPPPVAPVKPIISDKATDAESIDPILPSHLDPSSEASVELPVVPSPEEPSSAAPSPEVPSFSEDIP